MGGWRVGSVVGSGVGLVGGDSSMGEFMLREGSNGVSGVGGDYGGMCWKWLGVVGGGWRWLEVDGERGRVLG